MRPVDHRAKIESALRANAEGEREKFLSWLRLVLWPVAVAVAEGEGWAGLAVVAVEFIGLWAWLGRLGWSAGSGWKDG